MHDHGMAELVVDGQCTLAEGPVWLAGEQCLQWVDIVEGRVHRWVPGGEAEVVLETGQTVGYALPRRDGGLVLGLGDGVALTDPDGTIHPPLALEPDRPGSRQNDGACDAAGRLWAGTVPLDREPHRSALHRIDPDGTVTRVVDGASLSNGLDWSPDGRTFYWVDTPTGGVDAFDMDPAAGTLSNRRRAVAIPADQGRPDGLTVDAQGCLWVALYGGWAVRRYTPDGELLAVVGLPVAQVTSVAFGGADLSTLFVTTARQNLTPGDLAGQPAAGGVFAVGTGVEGRVRPAFAG